MENWFFRFLSSMFNVNNDRISLKGRSKVFYRKNNKEVILNSEFTHSNEPSYGIVIYMSEVKYWDKPNHIITESEFVQMKMHLEKELSKDGFKVIYN